MYKIFEQLLQESGVTAYRVAKEIGIAQSTLSNWRLKNRTPTLRTLQKIADYFGVSVNCFIDGENAPSESERLAGKIQQDERFESLVLRYFNLSDKKKELVLSLFEAAVTLAEE